MTMKSSMEDKKFDEAIRRLSLEAEPTEVPDVWGGIEKRLARKNRIILWRRIVISTSAAAVLALALFLPRGENSDIVSVVETERFSETALMQEERNLELVSGASDDMDAIPDKAAVAVKTAEIPETVETPETLETPETPETPETAEMPEPPETVEICDIQDLPAFSEEDSEYARRDISIAVSSDFYTIYGTGNVNFVRRSMSGGNGGSDISNVKPLAGSSPNHSIPLSAGVELQYGFGKKNSLGQHRMGIGIGVDYTYMRSSYQALVSKTYLGKYGSGNEQASVTQGLQYIGIPFSLYMNILTSDKLFFYASVGGEVEKGLQLKYRFVDINGQVSRRTESVSGVQWSANVGMGLEYRFVNFMGVYIDPRLSYFFNCAQPYSIREEQRWQLNLNLGFRFHL